MEKKDNVCPICGEPTSSYMGNYRKDGLCRKHAKDFKEGLIVQCPDCGEWHEKRKYCKCKIKTVKVNFSDNEEELKKITEKKTKNESNNNCIICGKKSNGKMQCKDCYNETRNHMDSLDKNSTVRKLRDYYYNLKERIVIINGLEETKKQCNRLIAIAMIEQFINDDNSLMDRVYKDVQSLIAKKQTDQVDNNKFTEERQEKDESKSRINTAQDGHNVDSDMEVHIDDILYNAYILHCYGKSVEEITEKRKKCDWFIPICNDKGIYIEYWGMNTPEYLKDRQEKEELYKKYNIPYIGIEKDDPKMDSQTFKSNLLRDLKKIAIERFGFMPEWKK